MTMRLILNGASGRMGKAVCTYVENNPTYQLVAALASQGNQALGKDVGAVHQLAPFGVPLMASMPEITADMMVDFSVPASILALLPLLVERRIPLVTGTTGFKAAERELLLRYTEQLPILIAPNTSMGAVLLAELAKQVTMCHSLWPHQTVIVDAHHAAKRDAPSGTAKMLQAAIQSVHAQQPLECFSVRAADLTGEHTIQCHGEGESVILMHQTRNRTIYAHGALMAAAWLIGRPIRPGGYVMQDVLFAS